MITNSYLNLPGTAREAFEFYRSVLGGEFTNVTTFRDFGGAGMSMPEEELDLIANIGLPIGQNVLMASDVPSTMPQPQPGNAFYVTLEVDSAAECERIYGALMQNGTVEMPLAATAWAELFGCFRDRFGVQWMVMYTGSVEM